ncbi:hypothetical protein QSH46_019760 [Xanthomonas arboricola pv. juglandis]|uniref:hypothetical protein n=1 Tax=Xanthomonas arboricola TaxID=56448 RepID=UPI000A5231E1|nr:hypothetical protein [Xanthomonas arboricola]MDN0222360.1 hypothetical protein [Xanthomonas arboricola pv. juglandis]MDN0226609.1 hypothetical protein [Xanthomonas arboricola pv. juglandis]MDN0230855.1 hypothetical protein [Xanthomonas arboricola pv. juglandis]MDN0235107.1 hypothetical protein [Xanthomonas arboricola pv. juglandis]MDN0239410.1 hypothetical protein [Xanthomonas arboricola pv. juglandis]
MDGFTACPGGGEGIAPSTNQALNCIQQNAANKYHFAHRKAGAVDARKQHVQVVYFGSSETSKSRLTTAR